jgi:DNA-binding GntR family transcriptional regulator
MLLEGYAARQAARNATEDDLQTLQELIREAEVAVHRSRPESLPEINDAFHAYIEGLARNAVLTRIAHLLREQTVAYRTFALGQPSQQRGFVDDHREILAALAAHNAELAESLAIQHLHNAVATLLNESHEPQPDE